MNAVISGQSGVAVLVDGSRLASIQADSDGEIVDRRPQEIRFLLNDARDLEFVEDVETEEIVRRLQIATSNYDALHTALILLDSELSHDTRRTAAEELEEDLADEGLARWVEGVLYAHPLPKSGDIPGARAACTGRTERVRAFLGRLSALQGTIAEVHEAWQRIPESRFGTAGDRQHTLSVAVKEGFFRELVTTRAAGEPVESFLATAILSPAFKQIRNSQGILFDWVAALPDPSEEETAREFGVSYVAETVPVGIPRTLGHLSLAYEIAGARVVHGNVVARADSVAILQRLRPRMKQILGRYRIPARDADDLIQEALLSTIQRWDKLQDPESAFLGALRNRCVVYWRKRRRGLYESVDSAILELLSEPLTAPQERAELLWDLNNLLEELPPRCRTLLQLSYSLGYDTNQVAEKMGVSPSTVRRMTRRCMAALTYLMVTRGFTKE